MIVMDVPFNFNEPAVGLDFLGREMECNSLSNMIRQGVNVYMYGPDGVGKRSLINRVFINLQKSLVDIVVCHVNLSNVRTEADFLRTMEKRLTLCGLENRGEDHRVLDLPEILARQKDTKVVLYFEEFQNVLHFDDPEIFLTNLEKVWKDKENVTYLITGSKVNAMKYIFEEKKYFYGMVENLPILPLNEKEVSDYIIRTFLRVGRVIDKDFVKLYYDISGGNPHYLWLLSSFSFSLTKGYVTPDIKDYSINSLLTLEEGCFKSMIDSLSNFQLNLLRAIFDGVTKLTNKEVIERYGLNSSANVHRLKDALKKKEIVYFDDKEEPHFVDPIFKYWLAKRYFI